MGTEIPLDTFKDNNGPNALIRQTGFYWVMLNDDWFLVQFNSRENLFYFPGYFEGVDSKQLPHIDSKSLSKEFEGYKRSSHNVALKSQPARPEGYYWVLHDAMWFAAHYLPSNDEFYFPGQVIGFDPSELEEINEQRIERTVNK